MQLLQLELLYFYLEILSLRRLVLTVLVSSLQEVCTYRSVVLKSTVQYKSLKSTDQQKLASYLKAEWM